VIVLVRHGRTAANAGGLLLGRLDPPLDELGARQAKATSVGVGELRDPRVVSSPLLRTRQSAEEIAARLGVAVEVDERWIEIDYGDWDGRPLAEVPAATWRAWRADLDLRPPGGETIAELGTRVRGAVADLVAEAAGRDVVVVSHVSPIKAAVAWALGVGDEVSWRLFLGPASITRIGVSTRGVNLVSFNETAHLLGLA
jgi:broad specificity phosphatase PhoE